MGIRTIVAIKWIKNKMFIQSFQNENTIFTNLEYPPIQTISTFYDFQNNGTSAFGFHINFEFKIYNMTICENKSIY